MHKCPKFNECSCNVCPLDTDMAQMRALPGEDRCRARRSSRVAVAAQYPGLLPTGGLTRAEVSGDRRRAAWLALPLEEREKRLSRLAAARAGAKFSPKDARPKDLSP